MVSKDDIYSDYFSVNLSSLIVIKTSVNLTIEYNSYVYPFGYQLVQSVNVVLINYDDYYNNKYLFVISENDKYLSNPAYEVATFKHYKLLKQWGKILV